MTIEQKRAVALASARLRLQQGGGAQPPAEPAVQDWTELGKRVDARQERMSDFRNPAPAGVSMARMDEARNQGYQHGLTQPAGTTFGREATNTFLMGVPNLLEAATSGYGTGLSTAENHEFIKSADAGRFENNPKASIGGSLAGTVAQSLVVPNPAASMSRVGKIGYGAATAGATSAVQGAVDSRGDVGEAAKQGAIGTAGGAVGGVVADKIGGAIGKVIDRAQVMKTAPAVEALKRTAASLYDRVDKMGVRYQRASVNAWATDLGKRLVDEGIDPDTTPYAFKAFKRIWADTNGDLGFKRLDTLRKIARAAASSNEGEERRFGAMIIDSIDDFVSKAGPNDIVTGSGDPAQASKLIGKARELWTAVKRSEAVDEKLYGAELQAAGTGSGANIDNATRQKFKQILMNPKARRGFTPEQIAAMERVVKGTAAGNAARLVGKMAPTGVVSGGIVGTAGVALGSAMGGPVGAVAVPAALYGIGGIAKKVGDRTTQKAAQYAESLARMPASQRAAMIKALQAKGSSATALELQLLAALTGGGAAVAGGNAMTAP